MNAGAMRLKKGQGILHLKIHYRSFLIRGPEFLLLSTVSIHHHVM